MKKSLFTTFFIALALFGISVAYAQNVIDVNINTLFNETKSNAAKAQQLYGNKTIRTTGIIQRIFNNSVILGYEFDWLYVYFIPSELPKLADLRKGQTITVRGKFTAEVDGILRNAVIETNPTSSSTNNNRSITPPTTAQSYLDSGIAAYNSKNYDRAIAELTQAIRLDPNFTDAYVFRGFVYNENDDYDKAIADASNAIRIAPNNKLAYNIRASAYLMKSDFDKAIADANQAIRIDPNYANPYMIRGHAYFVKSNFTQARTDANKSLQLDPNNKAAKGLDAELRKKGY